MARVRWVGAIMAIALAVTACGTDNAGSAPASAGGASLAPSAVTFSNIVKISGIQWFETMKKGMDAVASSTGMKVEQTGPTEATAEGQVSLIQSLIPQKPTVLGIVPNDQQAVEAVLASAQAAGIKTIASEGSALKNIDLDIEAMDNAVYGSLMMDTLAECMGNSGTYAAFVGNLTSASHMEWVDAALKQAQAKYPGITRVGDIQESGEDANQAYQKTKALLAKYPDLNGIEGSGATDVVGAARAVKELGLSGKICIVGTSLPSLAGEYLKDGTIYKILCWSPFASGEALAQGALFLAQGGVPKAGTDLHVDGYHNLQPCGEGAAPNCYKGDGQLVIGTDNMAQYDF